MDLRSGQPFWIAKNGLLATYPALGSDDTCDVAIIGGGITGALTAHRLTAEGVDVVLLDRRDVGSGSTAASTALLQYEIDTELVELAGRIGEANAVRAYRLGLEAIDEVERIVSELHEQCDFVRRTSIYLASSKQDAARLQAEFKLRNQHGFDVRWLARDQIEERFPFSAPAAILSAGNAEVDAFRLTHRLLAAAQRSGARVYDRTTVETIDAAGDGFRLQTDRGCEVRAKACVFATGYESEHYLKRKVGSLMSTYALVSEPLLPFPRWTDRTLIWETARPYFYARTTIDDRVIIGGEDTAFAEDHSLDRRIKRKSQRLIRRFKAMFPESSFETAYAWAGTFGETKDGLAYIGMPPDQPGTYFALGYGGNGITMSVSAAKIITDLIAGRKNEDAELFRFDR